MKNKLNISKFYPIILGIKNIIFSMFILLVCFPAFGQLSDNVNIPKTPSPKSESGEVISMRPIKIKSGIDSNEFEKWVMEYFNPTWEGLIPGVKSYIVTGDTRGKAKGEYAYVIIYDSLKTRNAYLPKEGTQSQWFKENYSEPISRLWGDLMDYLESPDTFSENYYSWVVLR